ncbi:MAG: hypothetical protein ACREBE_11080 [bacterium]
MLLSSTDTAIPAASTTYAACQGTHNVAWNATYENAISVMPEAGKIGYLFFWLTSDVGTGGASATLTLVKNGVDTAVTCAITDVGGSEVVCSSNNVWANFEAGDTCQMKLVTSGTLTASNGASFAQKFVSRHRNVTILMGHTTEASASANRFAPAVGSLSAAFLTEASVSQVAPGAGTLRAIYCRAQTAPENGGGTQTRTYTWRTNAASASSADCVLSESATTASATGLTNAIAAGDNIAWLSAPSGTPVTGVGASYGAAIVVPSPNSSWLMRSSSSTLSNSATSYTMLNAGAAVANASNALQQAVLPFTARVSSARVSLDGDPTAGGSSYAFTLLRGGSATSITCTVAAGATTCADSANSELFNIDYGSWQIVPTGTPTARRARVSFVVKP